jgi:RHS repeat-associated protein
MSNTARRTAITYPNGRVVTLGYGASGSIEDAFSLVKTVAIEGESGDKVDYTRVGLGRYVKIAYPQPGVEMSMIRPGGGSEGDSGDPYDGFDRFSRVQEMRWQGISSGTPIDAWKWGYNEASNRTWKKNVVAAGGQDEAYAYDGLSQVIRDAVGTLNTNRTAIGSIPGKEEDFTYDPTGNWLVYRKNEDGSPVLDQTRSNNKDNQLTQIDGSSQGIEYDRAGNAVKIRPGLDWDWSKHFTLVWDAWSRLVEVKAENGVTIQKNTYDGLSRRITKESGGKVVHTYWSDRWKPLEDRIDSETTAATQYLWGERPGHRDELVLRDRDTNEDGALDERLYAMMDYFNGSSILDTSGNVLERYAYGAFGPRRVMAPDFTSRGASLYDWDFGFQGQFRDAETGWYNYGYRFYVPELGRWINRDPIGEDGGNNIYLFALNNASGVLDYLGLTTAIEWDDTHGLYRNRIFAIPIGTFKYLRSEPIEDMHLTNCEFWQNGLGNRMDWGAWYQAAIGQDLSNITPLVNEFAVEIVDSLGITNEKRYGGRLKRNYAVKRISGDLYEFLIE